MVVCLEQCKRCSGDHKATCYDNALGAPDSLHQLVVMLGPVHKSDTVCQGFAVGKVLVLLSHWCCFSTKTLHTAIPSQSLTGSKSRSQGPITSHVLKWHQCCSHMSAVAAVMHLQPLCTCSPANLTAPFPLQPPQSKVYSNKHNSQFEQKISHVSEYIHLL